MTRVFLSIPVQGQRLPTAVYDAIIHGARDADLEIVNTEVNEPPTLAELSCLSPSVVHAHNRALLETANLVIAEISQPSLGVGYEIAVAETLGLPILALSDTSLLSIVSLMIRGLTYSKFQVVPYAHPGEVAGIIRSFVNQKFDMSRTEPDVAEIVSHFDNLSDAYDESTEWRQNEEILHWLASRLAGCKWCLDIGTGTGLVGAYIRQNGSKVVGLDQSVEMLRRANSRLDWTICGDATSLPFRATSFDGVALRSVLHYLDDALCLREAKRALRTDGVLVCAQATAAEVGTAAWWEFLKQRTQPLRRRFYTTTMLLQRFTSAGFGILENKVIRIARHETWEGLLRHCPVAEHDHVRAIIREAPQAVLDSNRLNIFANGITYEQHWTLLAATPTSDVKVSMQ